MAVTLLKKQAQQEKAVAQEKALIEVLKEELVPLVNSHVFAASEYKTQAAIIEGKRAEFEESIAAEVAELTALRKNCTDCWREIEDVVETHKPSMGKEDKYIIDAESCQLEIGAEGTKREITDKEGLIKALEAVDENLPFTIAKFNLGDLDKYLSFDEQEKFVTTNYTGSRGMKIKPLKVKGKKA